MKSTVANLLTILLELGLALILVTGLASAQVSTELKSSTDANTTTDPKAATDSKKLAASKQSDQSKTPAQVKSSAEVTPTSATVGEDAGNYTIVSTLEFGGRGLSVVGDHNKYRSDLNYQAGLRLFDSSFLAKSKNGKGFFDTLLVTATGWGADPNGQMRIDMENPKWYRFEGSYRRFDYFRFLNNFANPNYVFVPASFSVPPNPVTGYHGFDTRTQLGDFDLTILPKNERIRFTVGYSPERYDGPYFTTYHNGGNEFQLLTNARSRADDFRVGADGKLGPIDWTFLQGFRRFRDDNFVDTTPAGINQNPKVASLTSYTRNEPTRGSVDHTRASVHTFLAERLDITGRIIYSSATSNSIFSENFTGTNWNTRVAGQLVPPNILNLGQYNISQDVKRPYWLVDVGMTFLATSKFRISNTFRWEKFETNGIDVFADTFLLSRTTPPATSSLVLSGLNANRVIAYRKYQDTIEGDYQFNKNYSVHFGYRYGARWTHHILTGFDLRSNAPGPVEEEDEIDTNHTNVFFGGLKALPAKNWTIYFDVEHGTADNFFTRLGNYNYTNVRAKSRYAPNRKISFNLAVITRDNSNPSEIAGVSLADFGVNIKSRTFTSSIDWAATPRLSLHTGYNYNWVNSDAVIDYFYTGVEHPLGHTLYFMRNNFFFIDSVAQLFRRVTLFTSYRINKDNGQGDRLADPTGTPGTLINSYPMSFQGPEVRLAVKLNRRLDWNVGYQYYNYEESPLVGPRPQNYHAHLPYTSLRLYFGRKE
jgi:hypothetical protein